MKTATYVMLAIILLLLAVPLLHASEAYEPRPEPKQLTREEAQREAIRQVRELAGKLGGASSANSAKGGR